MIKTIRRSLLLMSLLTFLLSSLLMSTFLYQYFTQHQLDRLRNEVYLIAQGVEQEGGDYVQSLQVQDSRITWVAADGEVLYDSLLPAGDLPNHASRKEVATAYQTGQGESIRYSDTLTERFLYVAHRLTDGTVIRLSVSEQTVYVLMLGLLPWFGCLFVLLLLGAMALSKRLSRRILTPLSQIDLEHPRANQTYDELQPLLLRIGRAQQKIARQQQDLQQKSMEFETIISKIKEGLLLLDREGRIVSSNPAARELLQLRATSLGKELTWIWREEALVDLVTATLSGQKTEKLISLHQGQYKVLGRPIWSEEEVTGIVLLLFDVSEYMQLEQLRREFTSNVTHELRTPLQIMTGYSELLANQSLTPQDYQLFSKKIYQEVQRMNRLVEDILQLSELEEVSRLDKEELDLADLLELVVASLQEKAAKRGIDFVLELEKETYQGHFASLHSIFYNLCDNAIKYNREGGRVWIRLKKEEGGLLVEVEDTGLGIAEKDVPRIFDKFYRVDKSRSKQVGGTGLGLSIVKQALAFHQGQIGVASTVGLGTTMRVFLPQKETAEEEGSSAS